MEKIDLTHAKQMVDNYKATRKDLIDQTHGTNDTHSVWFDIASFKDFVARLPEDATGVRIHLAAYDHEHKTTPNQTTLVLAGTVAKGDDHVDAVSSNSLSLAGLDPVNGGKACPPDCN